MHPPLTTAASASLDAQNLISTLCDNVSRFIFVQGTAAMYPFWQDIRTYCLDPILQDLETWQKNNSLHRFEVDVHSLLVCNMVVGMY